MTLVETDSEVSVAVRLNIESNTKLCPIGCVHVGHSLQSEAVSSP